MMCFIEIPGVIEKNCNENLGETPEVIPAVIKINRKLIAAYADAVPNNGNHAAIIIYLKGGHQFYSPISIRDFEDILLDADEFIGNKIQDLKLLKGNKDA